MLNVKNAMWTCRSWLLASALVGLCACDQPIGVRLDVSAAVGCEGSPVEVSWVGDGNARYTLIHADGRRERVNHRDSRTLKAENVPGTRLTATRMMSPGFSEGFDFELVETEAVVPVQVNTQCGSLEAFEGREGIFASLDLQQDPQLVVSKVRLLDNRDVLSVEHASLRADMPEGQVLTTSFEGTSANGAWLFASPLRSAEACAPEDPSRVRPPSGFSAELIVSCGG